MEQSEMDKLVGSAMNDDVPDTQIVKSAAQEEDESFLDEYAGKGFESMDSSCRSVGYLSMVQPTSQNISERNPAGTWYSSSSGKNFGPSVTICVVDFKPVWVERNNKAPYNTIGRYEPKSIEVIVQQPKNSGEYPKMINPKSGLEIKELFMYAVMLPDYPEEGVLLFSPTVLNMKSCRGLNTKMINQRLPSGKLAPIFACKWMLTLALVENPQNKSQQISKIVDIQYQGTISSKFFGQSIKPALVDVKSTLLLTAGEESGE